MRASDSKSSSAAAAGRPTQPPSNHALNWAVAAFRTVANRADADARRRWWETASAARCRCCTRTRCMRCAGSDRPGAFSPPRRCLRGTALSSATSPSSCSLSLSSWCRLRCLARVLRRGAASPSFAELGRGARRGWRRGACACAAPAASPAGRAAPTPAAAPSMRAKTLRRPDRWPLCSISNARAPPRHAAPLTQTLNVLTAKRPALVRARGMAECTRTGRGKT